MKLEEIELLKAQVANLQVDNAAKAHALAMQARDALSVELVRKYGLPGETSISWQPDGTIVRATPLMSVPEEVSGG